MGALSENWLGGFRVVDDGRQSVANYVWDTGTLSWVVQEAAGAAPGGNVNIVGSITLPVSGTFYQATQPVSLTSTTITGSVAVTGPLTDTQLRATPVPVSLTSTTITGTVAVTGALTDTQLRATPVPVSLTSTTITGTVAVTGALTDTQLRATPVPIANATNDLAVTATGAAAAAVTLTLPAVAGQFHYIQNIEITMYSTVARAGTATPVLVTSTNLPGAPVWTFPSAGAIGTITQIIINASVRGLRSSVVNTATTIVCPATASVIWRVNVIYRTAA